MVRLSKKARGRLGRDCSSAPESVELLGKERSSDQCHMMQEVCQHFSSSSLAKGRSMHALAAGERQIMEASHEPGDPSDIILSQLAINFAARANC